MSEMVEQAALAIGEARMALTGGTQPRMPSDVLYARAAIAAMREPTEEMMDAVRAASYEAHFETQWHVAIDAALNEKEAPPVREGL
jgi:hypothetical protein